jgi:hypothetical protein
MMIIIMIIFIMIIIVITIIIILLLLYVIIISNHYYYYQYHIFIISISTIIVNCYYYYYFYIGSQYEITRKPDRNTQNPCRKNPGRSRVDWDVRSLLDAEKLLGATIKTLIFGWWNHHCIYLYKGKLLSFTKYKGKLMISLYKVNEK